MKTYSYSIKTSHGEAQGTYQAETAKEVEDFLTETYAPEGQDITVESMKVEPVAGEKVEKPAPPVVK